MTCTQKLPDYTNKLISTLNELRKENELCDVIIKVGERQFPAHKDVLAASSNYFRGMFMHGFRESMATEIKIDGNPEIFEILLDYAYTGQMKIVPKIAYDILEMGCYMQFTDICQYCSRFMDLSKNFAKSSENIKMGDVFRMYLLAKIHSDLEDVVETSLKHMSENIAEVKETKYFLQTASTSFFDDFLKRQDLSCEQEEIQVLEMVINWLKHDWTNRRQHTLSLLQQVKLGHVPQNTLEELLDAQMLEIPGCRQLLDNVLTLVQKLQGSEVSKTDLSSDYPDLFATRSTVTVPIALTHGELQQYEYDFGADSYYFCYLDLNSKKWIPLKHFATLNHIASIFVHDGILYAVASSFEDREDADVDGRELLQYDVERNQWEELSSMQISREANTFPIIHMGGYLYVFGGSNWHGRPLHLSHVERLDLSSKTWQLMNPLPDGYRWNSAIVFEGTILMCGEKSHHPQEEHIIVAYDSVLDMWHTALSEQRQVHYFLDTKQDQLFQHRNSIYRIRYEQASRDRNSAEFYLEKPKVDLMRLRFLRNAVSITVEEEISQDLIPVNDIGAFRIRNEVFINIHGFVRKEDIEIADCQVEDINVDAWKNAEVRAFDATFATSNIALFTLDKKKLGVIH